ncbi:hypothetical protein LCGC14_2131750 [marine sediment metagenome]|uniref:Uncharacterized protein n=1 Tax=marine sediment metagenome TaxID=412755 RepID=A0A0F9ENE9_9ZZZZ|nr:hypothetical protein [Bacteroides sp.]
MEQRDYLMRQIEQLGQVLAKALAGLLNLKQVPDASLSIDEIRQIYGEELDITLDLVLVTPKEEIISVLMSRVKFIDHHLDTMAELLSETAELYDISDETGTAKDLRKKALYIYEYLQETSGTYSIDQAMKITQLKQLL